MQTKFLILDLGGVIINDPMQQFFDKLDSLSRKSREEIVDFYSDNLRDSLWSGALEEKDFWLQLFFFSEVDQSNNLSDYIRELSFPLPAADRLLDLQKTAPLIALSNHRSEWIRPVLIENNLNQYFQEIFISSEIGVVKPDPESIEYVLNQLNAQAEEVVFVDDKERNLKTAKKLGVKTILAGPSGKWLDWFLRDK